jgi:hypothetical protein
MIVCGGRKLALPWELGVFCSFSVGELLLSVMRSRCLPVMLRSLVHGALCILAIMAHRRERKRPSGAIILGDV